MYYIISKEGIHGEADSFERAWEQYQQILTWGYSNLMIVKKVNIEVKEIE